MQISAILLTVFGISGMSAIVLRGWAHGDAVNDPAISVSPREVDLGESLRQGQKYTADVKVANRGPDEVHIVRFEVDCGCTVVIPERKRLLPGDSISATATVDTGLNRGRFARHCTLVYKHDGRVGEPDVARIPFLIRGRITPEFEVVPRIVAFDQKVAGQTAGVTFVPQPGASLDLRVSGVSVHGLSARVLPGSRAEGSQGIEITFHPEEYRGNGEVANVTVATGNVTEAVYSIEVLIR